jgi:phytoene synthase
MVEDRQVAKSKAIQQRTGKTFHLATRLLPERVRHATYVLYGFFRVADDVVDDVEDPDPSAQRATLERFREAALGERPFAEVKANNGIPDADVEAFVDAMEADITKSRYETYAELETYMDGSAAAVGRMMTAVMDLPEERERKALPHATALGEAFQLTNFLRDVREDIVERDRIYLPQETLAEYDVTEEQLLAFEYDERFVAAMNHELRRTEALYKEGVAGIKHLPEDCQFAVLLAAVLYADHHRLIRERRYDVLSETPQLGTLRKALLLARTRWHWALNRDPEAVFRRVSAVPYGGTPAQGPDSERRDWDWLPTR